MPADWSGQPGVLIGGDFFYSSSDLEERLSVTVGRLLFVFLQRIDFLDFPLQEEPSQVR